jgi:hypothetical protein
MKKSIVYVLGAGFSKPFGLPLMNGISKRIEAYAERQEKDCRYKEANILLKDTIVRAGRWVPDSNNFESIFSVIDWQDFLNRTSKARDVLKPALAQLVKECYIGKLTSKREHPTKVGEKCWSQGVISTELINGTLNWVGSMVGVSYTKNQSKSWHPRMIEEVAPELEYHIITFNYDEVIEDYVDHLNLQFSNIGVDPLVPPSSLDSIGRLRKIIHPHGRASSPDSIVPPTFLKGDSYALPPRPRGQLELEEEEPRSDWREISDVLKEASIVRIIGFSLPPSDALVAVLMQNSLSWNTNLERVEVFNYIGDSAKRQSSEMVRRFRDSLDPDKLWFFNSKTEDLMVYFHNNAYISGRTVLDLSCKSHEALMNSYIDSMYQGQKLHMPTSLK